MRSRTTLRHTTKAAILLALATAMRRWFRASSVLAVVETPDLGAFA